MLFWLNCFFLTLYAFSSFLGGLLNCIGLSWNWIFRFLMLITILNFLGFILNECCVLIIRSCVYDVLCTLLILVILMMKWIRCWLVMLKFLSVGNVKNIVKFRYWKMVSRFVKLMLVLCIDLCVLNFIVVLFRIRVW